MGCEGCELMSSPSPVVVRLRMLNQALQNKSGNSKAFYVFMASLGQLSPTIRVITPNSADKLSK